ncbi:MAG: hypothetical protein ABL865_08085, partial [Candidatus Nitrotoga sp.]
IPQSRMRGHAGLNQRFLNFSFLVIAVLFCRPCSWLSIESIYPKLIYRLNGKCMTGLSGVLKIDADVADAQEKLRRSLLVFACALMSFSVMLWLAIYWMMGLKYSTNVPLAYQVISITSLLIYLKNGNFIIFRFVQLSLFLFSPFI